MIPDFFSQSTIQQLLTAYQTKLDQKELYLLLTYVTKKSYEQLLAHPETQLGPWQHYCIHRLVSQRNKGIPIAYLVGHKEFYALDFTVNKNTLIPRPETELLIDQVLNTLKQSTAPTLLIDIGTGSGCIPITIAKHIDQSRKKLQIYASDLSKPALRIAKKNAAQHAVTIQFFQGDLFNPYVSFFKQHPNLLSQTDLIITANLPYLTPQQFSEEPSIQHEPIQALVTKDQGLFLYKQLLQQLAHVCSHQPIKSLTLYIEFDPVQAQAIKTIILKHFSTATVQIFTDYREHARVIQAKLV